MKAKRAKPQPVTNPGWTLKDGVTQSLLGAFMRCPEMLRLGYEEKLEQITGSGALQFGTVFHKLLEIPIGVLKDGGPEERSLINNIRKAFLDENIGLTTDDARSMEKLFHSCIVLWRAHREQWNAGTKGHTIVAVEQNFSVPITIELPSNLVGKATATFPIRGKIDKITRDKTGKLWVWDTKTKSSISDETIPLRIPYDMQCMSYLWAVEQIYKERPAGIVYDLVRRPQLRQKQNETDEQFIERIAQDIAARKDEYFLRYTCSISPGDTEEWLPQFHSLLRSLWLWTQGQYHYRNNHECIGQYGACRFLPICSRKEDAMKYYRRRESIFPELEMK